MSCQKTVEDVCDSWRGDDNRLIAITIQRPHADDTPASIFSLVASKLPRFPNKTYSMAMVICSRKKSTDKPSFFTIYVYGMHTAMFYVRSLAGKLGRRQVMFGDIVPRSESFTSNAIILMG
jgi:hypothetical protein